MSALASWLTHAALQIFHYYQFLVFLQKNSNFFNDKKKIGREKHFPDVAVKQAFFYITNKLECWSLASFFRVVCE
jgi:hypothetical protein